MPAGRDAAKQLSLPVTGPVSRGHPPEETQPPRAKCHLLDVTQTGHQSRVARLANVIRPAATSTTPTSACRCRQSSLQADQHSETLGAFH